MKKSKIRVWAILLAAAAVLAILFVPIPGSPYRDGGTREYTALTYKIVDWNRLTEDGIYDATKLYWIPDNFKSVDELWPEEEQAMTHRFTATVLEIDSTSVLVHPVAGETELLSADLFSISTQALDSIGAKVGSVVDIYYTGGIMESYPAQIHAVKWNISGNLRHMTYPEQWLDREKAVEDYGNSEHLVITEIYADCFFGSPVVPMPYRYKINGQLSEDWCVGDQVYCTFENSCCDSESYRIEADLVTVEPSDFELEPGVAYKPVIYLYPEAETDVTVELLLDGKLTCTYPAYDSGWHVTAAPDGTLTDAKGQTYNYLYWEGQTHACWDFSSGFCVRGEDTAAFLEEALEKLGLNRREANEFIVYWLPLMEPNAYNRISFQTDVYTDAAKLHVSPTPDTLIRVFMAWQSADSYVEMEPQSHTAPDRTGFTVVEWGGAEVSLP